GSASPKFVSETSSVRLLRPSRRRINWEKVERKTGSKERLQMADSPLLFACGINFSYQLGIDEEECNGSSSGWPTVTLSREASSMEEKGAGTSGAAHSSRTSAGLLRASRPCVSFSPYSDRDCPFVLKVSGGMRRQPSEAPPSHAGGCLQWDARDICDSIHRLPKQLPLDWLDMQVAGRPAAIAAGAHHSVLMTERGSVYLWGFHAGKVYPTPQPAPFGIPLKCVQIACGRKHTLLLMEGGFVMTFGIGYFGQLGHGDSASYGRPRLLRRLDPQRLGDRVVELAGGGYHSAARMRGGAIMAWGFNRYGQCGNGDKESTILEPSPCRLEALGSDSPAQIVCGRHHCAVMTRSGAVYSWGACGFGRLGVADMSQKVAAAPTLVPYFNKSPAAALATGDFHMLALGRDGGVYSWGYSQEGQGGHGGTLHLRLPRLLEFFRDKAVTQVACGAWSSHAVTADGTAYAWGSSDGGWTGLPLAPDAMVVEPGPAAGRHIVTRSFDSDHNCLVPQRVATLEDFAVRQLAC
ncbi:unnamed protein product, partial [Phaeothamnion confervicola]